MACTGSRPRACGYGEVYSLGMRSPVGRGLVAAVGVMVASACAGDPPTVPSQPGAPTAALRAIAFDAPSVITIGDAPVALRARVELSDGTIVDIAKVKCTATWTSSEPGFAAVLLGVLEARSIGDATIAVTCRELRAERVVRVRRRLTGTVIAGDDKQPIGGAVVSIVSGPDSGIESRTDSAGRFTLPVPAAFDLQASALAFDSARLPISASQDTVQLTLQPTILKFRWEGWFGTPDPMTGYAARLPEGDLDGFVFETHRTGELSLALFTSCQTYGTYESFDARLKRDGQIVLALWAERPPAVGLRSMRLSPGSYRLELNSLSIYAKPGCTWWLEMSRPY